MFLTTAKPNTLPRTMDSYNKGAQTTAKNIREGAQDPSGAAANQPSVKALQAPLLAADPLGCPGDLQVSLLLADM